MNPSDVFPQLLRSTRKLAPGPRVLRYCSSSGVCYTVPQYHSTSVPRYATYAVGDGEQDGRQGWRQGTTRLLERRDDPTVGSRASRDMRKTHRQRHAGAFGTQLLRPRSNLTIPPHPPPPFSHYTYRATRAARLRPRVTDEVNTPARTPCPCPCAVV